MVETKVLQAKIRKSHGTQAARKERAAGLIPAIIYGHKQEPVSIVLDAHDLNIELMHHHRLLEIELDGKKEQFLLKDVQYDYLGDTVIHVDLNRVDLSERVEVSVEVAFKGTPKGVHEGGTLDIHQPTVELECLVTNIPESVRADVSEMKLGDDFVAGSLVLPDGVKLLTPPETVLAVISMVSEEAVEEPSADTGATEPEVIARETGDEEKE